MPVIFYFASLTFLLSRLAPAINWKDSGELISAAHLITPAHFPGYPLYVLLAKPFLLIPAGSMATRASLANAVCGAALVGLFIWAASRLSRGAGWRGICLTAITIVLAGLLALSPIFLEETTIAENTMPFLLLLGLAFIPTLRPHDLTGSRDHGFTGSRLHGPTGSRPHDLTTSRLLPFVALMLSYHPFLALAGGSLVIALLVLIRRGGHLFVASGFKPGDPRGGGPSAVWRSAFLFAACLALFLSAHTLSFARTGRTVALTDASMGSWSEFRSTMQYHLGRWGVAQKSGREDAPFGCVQVWAESAVLEGHAPSGPESDVTEHVPPRMADRGEGRTPKYIPRFKLDLLVADFPLLLIPFWLIGFWVHFRRRPFEGALHGLFFLMFFFIYFSQYGQELRGLALPLFLYATGWTFVAADYCLGVQKRNQEFSPQRRGVRRENSEGGRTRSKAWVGGVIGIVTIVLVGREIRDLPQRAWGWDQFSLGCRLVSGLEPNSVWLTPSARIVPMVYYSQYVEQARPDVDLVVEFSPLHTSHWVQTLDRLGLQELDPRSGDRVVEVYASTSRNRPVYRDSALAEISWTRLPGSAPDFRHWVGVSTGGLIGDFWGLAAMMFQGVDREGLEGAYQVTNRNPEIPVAACGMLARLGISEEVDSTPPESCNRLQWPEDRGPQSVLNREVLAYLRINRGHYHLSKGELDEAVESFRTLVRLHPVTTR